MPSFVLKYGTFAFDPGEAAVAISRSSQFDEKGEREREIETWTITGTLVENTAADFTTRIDLLEAAFAADDLDLIMFEGNGTTETSHKLKQSDTLGGIKVETVSFPRGADAEYATVRNYQIVVSAEFEAKNIAPVLTDIVSFSEVLTIWGGGQRIEWQETIEGVPQKFQVAANTLFRATQVGSAVGRDDYPTVPAPIFGADVLLEPNPRIIRRNPERIRVSPTEILKRFPVSWEYEFTSAFDLVSTTINRPGSWL